MNAYKRHLNFLLVFGLSLLLLPACGNKNAVKSQKANETVLNINSTPTPQANSWVDIGMADETKNTEAVPRSYTEKIKSEPEAPAMAAAPNSISIASLPPTPIPTAPNVPMKSPSIENIAPVKKNVGTYLILWFLVILALGGAGYYFWSKTRVEEPSGQPQKPLGGLSPVSGFTAIRGRLEKKKKAKKSFWLKKIF